MSAYDQAGAEKAAARMREALLDGWLWTTSQKGTKYWNRVYVELSRIAEGGVP